MGKPLMILRRTLVCTCIAGYLAGCATSTQNAPIRTATLSSGNGQTASSAGTSNNATGSSLGSESGGWLPTPPKDISTNSTETSTQQVVNNASTAVNNGSTTISNATNNAVTTAGSAVPNRNYSDIPKGSFAGERYVVARGDTLFYIAWISGNDYRELAAKNNIAEPYSLTVGQTLDVSGGSLVNGSSVSNNTATNTVTTSTGNRTNSSNNTETSSSQNNTNVDKMGSQTTSSPTTPSTPTQSASTAGGVSANVSKINWLWPADGKVIEQFSTSDGGNKGIDIAGSKGQSILSAADGRVVYAGNALKGYGNLIIIKHNDDYLSAYAHNDTMLVSEQQDVKAGQKIATMGSTGASSVRLHFEVRYKGKSVNPLQYLPQR